MSAAMVNSVDLTAPFVRSAAAKGMGLRIQQHRLDRSVDKAEASECDDD